jgi:hypothetical protein
MQAQMLGSSDNYRQNQTFTEPNNNLKRKSRALFRMTKNEGIHNTYVEDKEIMASIVL